MSAKRRTTKSTKKERMPPGGAAADGAFAIRRRHRVVVAFRQLLAAPARVNPAEGTRRGAERRLPRPTARCAPAPFGSLVGDYGAVPAYAAAPSPPMRENNAESEPRATSPPDDTSARYKPAGTTARTRSLRGRAPRVVVDTVALRGVVHNGLVATLTPPTSWALLPPKTLGSRRARPRPAAPGPATPRGA